MNAGDPGRLPPPGHYAGTTSQGGTISFDVSARGWHVSNLMLMVSARPLERGRSVRDLPLAIDRIFPVAPGGRWRARIADGDVTVTIEAQLNGAGIKGELAVDLERSEVDQLSTGLVTWYAKPTS